jgi:hypothetical protein
VGAYDFLYVSIYTNLDLLIFTSKDQFSKYYLVIRPSVTPLSSIRAISQSVLSEEPDSLIKEPDFKIIYKFLIKDKGQNLIK